MVTQGATTIWELWNGDHGNPAMNSGNHVMLLGDLIIWYYENLAGIKANPEVPAFKNIIMKPYVLGGLTNVDASYNSIYGKIKSKWNLENGGFNWSISIPANTTATVYIPTLEKEDVMEGNKLASNSEGMKFIRWEKNWAVFEVGSGNYSFTSKGTKMNITRPYVSAPQINPNNKTYRKGDKVTVNIECETKDAVIRYTLDGSAPNNTSSIYSEPIVIESSTTVSARAFMDGMKESMISIEHYDFLDAEKNGINWSFYEGKFKVLPNFDELKPDRSGTIYHFGIDKIELPKYNFALLFNSFIQIDDEGEYEFSISSNDGSKLYIDDEMLVDNDQEHGPRQLSGAIHLAKGKHKIRVEYFQSGGSKTLQLFYKSDKISFQLIPASLLFKNKN
jgi:hypothetical protein